VSVTGVSLQYEKHSQKDFEVGGDLDRLFKVRWGVHHDTEKSGPWGKGFTAHRGENRASPSGLAAKASFVSLHWGDIGKTKAQFAQIKIRHDTIGST